MSQVPNFLFISEGFQAADRGLFEGVAADMVDQLRTKTSARPFDLLKNSVNYWRVFVPSPQSGGTALHELDLVTRVGGPVGTEIEPPRRPDPAAAATLRLDELIHEVGLPLPADGAAAVTFATKLPVWTAVYNVAAGRVNAALFTAWKDLHDRRLANERDTALGLASGQRPAAMLRTPARYIGYHRLRTSRAHLDQFLATLTDGPGGPVIGATWVTPGGKDRDLVMALCAGFHGGGGVQPDPADYQRSLLVSSGLAATQTEVLLTAVGGSREVNVRPHPVPRKGNGRVLVGKHVLATFMHETAHAFGLDEEYGGRGSVTAMGLARVRGGANTQAMEDLVTAPSTRLEGDKVKWQWPRLRLAGQLAGAVVSEGGGVFRIPLTVNHAVKFALLTAPDNMVHLRQPLTNGAATVGLSGPLEVVGVVGDAVRVRDPAGALVPGGYPPGSVLCRPVPPPASAAAAGDTHAHLMAQVIRAHITGSGGPLNAPSATPLRPCAPLPDPTQIMNPSNRPPGLPAGRPRFSNWIVGVYEGGSGYDCGAFHPTGVCMMRQLRVPTNDPRSGSPSSNPGVIYRFCHVCQYVLVDRIDPRQHVELDRQLIAPEYPQP